MQSGYDQWTWELFLLAAEKCFEGRLSVRPSPIKHRRCVAVARCAVPQLRPVLVDDNGNITANSDNVRAVLDYARRLASFLPSEIYSWDNAPNNRALIGGKSALI